MSDRYPGGLITKTPVTPAGPYQDGAAPGIWTLEQQAYYKAQGLWPIAGNVIPSDDYFKYVTMLLTGNGTNGAQNNTFLDSSTNAFSITRNGNTTQGSFSPYGSLWSNYFDGSNSKLTVANNTALNFGTGDFTIEYWFYLPSFSGNAYVLLDKFNSGSGWQFYTYSDNKLHFYLNSADLLTTTTSIVAGNWYHVAVTRSGTSAKLFLNGVLEASATNSTDISPTTDFRIGETVGGVGDLVGYVSNARIVKGTALYTANFTPSTTPLTAVSGTSLLTCQSNRFIDNSSNAFSITVNGTPSVQRFSPFNPTASYSTATIGGSGYFDGSGDYLTVADNAAFDVGSSDFTVECWVYSDFSGAPGIFGQWNSGGYAPISGAINSSYVYFTASSDGSNWDLVGTASSARMYNAWTHVAWVRYGNEWSIYVNGVKNIVSASQSFTPYNSTDPMVLGARYNGSNPLNGNISGFRFVKGTAVYTTTFTPPTAPPTAISGTSLLVNFTNAGIPDSAMMNDLETVGNAQVSTSVKKFGTGSLYFDGTGDYLKSNANTSLYTFGTGDFTIEMWLYANSFAEYSCVYDSRGQSVNGYYPCIFFNNSSGQLVYYVNSSNVITASSNLSTGTWYHLAVCRSGTSTKMFIDGTQTGSTWTDSSNYLCDANRPLIGTLGYYPDYVNFNGYIDDLRITKGYARYTANFTPPTAALPTF